MVRTSKIITDDKRKLYERLRAEKIYRSLKSDAEKSDYLNRTHGFQRWELLQLKVCTKKVWERMVSARKHNRQLGARGRPRLLSPTSESTVVAEALLQYEDGNALSVKQLSGIVCIFLGKP